MKSRGSLLVFDSSYFNPETFKHFIDLAFDNIITPIVKHHRNEDMTKALTKRSDHYLCDVPVQKDNVSCGAWVLFAINFVGQNLK